MSGVEVGTLNTGRWEGPLGECEWIKLTMIVVCWCSGTSAMSVTVWLKTLSTSWITSMEENVSVHVNRSLSTV